MAIYSFSVKLVGPTQKLKSCVAAAAYRAGERLHDEKIGLTHDFTDKRVEHSEILAPEGAPDWVYDRQKLWNQAEKSTTRVLGITAREIRITLPRELSREQHMELMRSFLRDEFVSLGMVVDWSIHNEPGKDQPHAHVMLSVREVKRDGFGKRGNGFGKRIEAWDARRQLYRWRREWAHYANRALELAGHEERIDHRSYKDRGINLAPQPKLYRHRDEAASDTRDNVQERLQSMREVAYANGERIKADPTIPLRILTHQRATFRREDVLKILHTHSLDAEQFNECLHAVMNSPELVELPNGRYTSREMLSVERRLLNAADELATREVHQVEERHVEVAIANAEERLRRETPAGQPAPKLGKEQREALTHLTVSSGGVAVLEGRAGTGKSTILDAGREAWEAQGFTVVGGALAGKAAEGLQHSSGIASRTLASWERSWSLERDELTSKHVLVIDEAGMLGSRQLGRVLEYAREAGAKVVLVGDSQQLQAIEAGSPFRAIAERIGAKVLAEVRRQRVDWQQAATVDFWEKRAEAALQAYQEHGAVKAHKTVEEAREAVVGAWAKGLEQTPIHKQMMFAYRRSDVHELNRLARDVYATTGALGREQQRVETHYGDRTFATGDRVFFGKNDRELDVKNGTFGTVEVVRPNQLVVRIDGEEKRRVRVDLTSYNHIDYGYAATVHKSQGATLDRTYVLASQLFDASTTRVAMSRHRDHVELHWSRDEFGTRAELWDTLCRERPKELASDSFEHGLVERGSATLEAVLEDDSRFALLAPDAQRALIEEHEQSYAELREQEPSKPAYEFFEELPKVRDAKALEAKAAEQLREARDALANYERTKSQRRWYQTLREPEENVRERVRIAEEALIEARRARQALDKDPKLRKEADEIAGRRNRRHVAYQTRLQRWREHMAKREREGLLEHKLERLREKKGVVFRLATDADHGKLYEVTGKQKLGTLRSTGEDVYAVGLKSEQGELLLQDVPRYATVDMERGRQVQLGRDALGKIELRKSRGLDRGRAR